MGELVRDQRIELLAQLQDLSPDEVPINFLNPRPGTPLANGPLVEPLDAIRWISLFRLALPDVILRYAGGREVTLRELQALGLTAGINALIVGNYLTTLGRDPQEDLQMLADLRMPRLDGAQFYLVLQHQHPALAGRVMFLSGDITQLTGRGLADVPRERILVKPVELAELERRIVAFVRAAAVEGLAHLSAGEARALLELYRQDKEPAVKRAAEAALK